MIDIDEDELFEKVQERLVKKYRNKNIKTFWELNQIHPEINELILYYIDLYFDDNAEINKLIDKIAKKVIKSLFGQSDYDTKKESIPKNPHFDNLNDLILDLFDFNRKINNGHKSLINERDRLIEIILYDWDFAGALYKKANNTVNYYKSLNSQFSYDVETVKLKYHEIATGRLQNVNPNYKVEDPTKYLSSFLFKKGIFNNKLKDMDSLDYGFKDWVKLSTTYLQNENLGSNIIHEEGEIVDSYSKALNDKANNNVEIVKFPKFYIDFEYYMYRYDYETAIKLYEEAKSSKLKAWLEWKEKVKLKTEKIVKENTFHITRQVVQEYNYWGLDFDYGRYRHRYKIVCNEPNLDFFDDQWQIYLLGCVIGGLKDKECHRVLLKYYQNLKNAEIGEKLGVDPKNVREMINNSIVKIRKKILNDYHDDKKIIMGEPDSPLILAIKQFQHEMKFVS
jgi:hypothetical protein